MLSERTHHSVRRLWEATIASAQSQMQRKVAEIAAEAASNGMTRSTRHVQLVDRAAGETLLSAASEMYGHFVEANSSEPCSDSEGRIEVFTGLFQQSLRSFHFELRQQVNALGNRLALQMDLPTGDWTREIDDASSHVQKFWPEKIRLTVLTTANAAARGSQMTHHINVTGSTVGNIQVGANSTANAHQTVTQTTGADAAALVASLTELLEGLSRAATGSQADRAEVAEVLTELRTEVTKPVPNRRRVAALMTGAADVVKLVPGLAKTWELASTHGHLLIEGLSKIAT